MEDTLIATREGIAVELDVLHRTEEYVLGTTAKQQMVETATEIIAKPVMAAIATDIIVKLVIMETATEIIA